MVCRGLWNLYVNGKWYRSCGPRGRISPPDDKATLQRIKQLHEKTEDLNEWEIVPFPSPIHSDLDYIYIVDQDAGTLTISLWGDPDGLLRPMAIRVDLSSLYEPSDLSINSLLQHSKYSIDYSISGANPNQVEPLISRMLNMDFGIPTAMNELQERFFTDLVFTWRFYIDDPLTWRYNSPVFNVLCIAFLRLAAWDFEVSSDFQPELPISFTSIPNWRYPEVDIYWFHGFLILLQEDIGSEAAINKAVLKAKSYLDNSRFAHHNVRSILISLRHVAFAKFSHDIVLRTINLTLLDNSSATRCSPGFRALARVLSSGCWKNFRTHRERWHVNMPFEILRMILCKLEPRDAVAFAQASFAAEECYYTSIPQFNNINVRSFESSIPCCGKRDGLEAHGICCSKCYAWQHSGCVSLEAWSSDNQYICSGCQESKTRTALDPGGINRVSRRKKRGGCRVQVGSSIKSLQLRLSKPSHLRKELRFLGNLVPIAPSLIDYTLLFNGSFSGLAYGLEDGPSQGRDYR